MSTSDGSTADYYKLPAGATELQDLISHRDMNSQIGEIFRACYRYGIVSHSGKLRDAKKIRFYAEAEVKRLEKLLAQAKVLGCCETIDPADVEISEHPSFEFAPDWANWTGQDADGTWYWFSAMPQPFGNGWATDRKHVEITSVRTPNKYWFSTLAARPIK